MTNVPTSISCRVGVDLSSVSEVEAAVRALGDRYLQRVFTANELDDCRRPAGLSMESLAARFSAKEATIKVLQPPAQQPAWSAMEVLRRADGSCVMALTGTAAQLAEDAGIASLSLSMTHDGDQAAAVVFALCGSTVPTELRLGVGHHAGEELKFTPWRYAGSPDG